MWCWCWQRWWSKCLLSISCQLTVRMLTFAGTLSLTHLRARSTFGYRREVRYDRLPSSYLPAHLINLFIYFFKVQSHFLFSTQEKKQQHFLSVTYTVLILMVKIAVIVIIVVIVVFNLECCCYFILKSQVIHECTWFLCCFHVQTDGSNNYCIFQIQYWNSSAEDEEEKKKKSSQKAENRNASSCFKGLSLY